MKKYLYTVVIALSLFAVDFITKFFVEKYIAVNARVDVLGSFVQLTRIYNEGGVFGILQGYKNLFLVVSIIVFIALLAFYYIEKNKSYLFCTTMGLIFSGALGNITDRLLGKKGVVDFIYIGVDNVYRWPAFNVADSCIVIGGVLLLIIFFLQERKNKKEEAIK